MRRWLAILLLCLASVYLGATSLDHCSDGLEDDCAPVCHVFCADGWGPGPVSDAGPPPRPGPRPGRRFEAERVVHLVSLDIEPEKDPPRA